MAQNNNFMSRDLIITSLSSRIDWRVLEDLVYTVLVNDDLPSLRKIGGGHDFGVDAEEVTYDTDRKRRTIVQVSSSSAQTSKVITTIRKLTDHSIDPKKLIYVTNISVGAETKRDILEKADAMGVDVDIRDQDYIAAQLSRAGSVIYARFFGSVEAQRDILFGQHDALGAAPDALQHSLLATMGAFVLTERARIARKSLLDNTVLASIASRSHSDEQKVIEDVMRLCPGEQIDHDRVSHSIRRLLKRGDVIKDTDNYTCSPEAIGRFIAIAQSARDGFHLLVQYVVTACNRNHKLTEAQEGFLERNIRHVLLRLLKVTGPAAFNDEGLALQFTRSNPEDFRSAISKNIPSQVVKTAMAAFAAFVGSGDGVKALAPLIRSYGALAIRNVDPIGKGWQHSVLSRNCLALDSDAVLSLIIKELPEHRAIVDALLALQSDGVQLILPKHVLDEVIDHIGRADRTFSMFRTSLLRMPIEAVQSRVWSAIVRGYYFSHLSGGIEDFAQYWSRYWDEKSPRAYIENILSRRLPLISEDLAAATPSWSDDMEQLAIKAIKNKESHRPKALYRDEWSMAARVRSDVCMAFNISEKASQEVGGRAKGYIVTSDGMFRFIEDQEEWRQRPSVSLATLSLPQLASFICGNPLDDESAVELLFHEISVAAAAEMADEIAALAAIGVDLARVPLDRLEWDLRETLKDRLNELEAAIESEEDDAVAVGAAVAMRTLEAAKNSGYELAKPVEALIEGYEASRQAVHDLVEDRRAKEDLLKEFVRSAIDSSTAKTKARLRRIAKDLGIDGE